jgi:hypothetical protein
MEPASILCPVDTWRWGTEDDFISVDAGTPGTSYGLCPAENRKWGEAASFLIHTNGAQGKCITSELWKHGSQRKTITTVMQTDICGGQVKAFILQKPGAIQ